MSSRARTAHNLFGLRHHSDLRALAVLSVQTILMIGLWTGFGRNLATWYAVAWLAVMAANAKHHHRHRRTFRARWPNLLLDHWLGWMTGTTATSILTEHNLRHHGHSNTEADFVRADLVNFHSQGLNVVCLFPRATHILPALSRHSRRLPRRTSHAEDHLRKHD